MKLYIAGVLPGSPALKSDEHRELTTRLRDWGHTVLNPPATSVLARIFQSDVRTLVGTLVNEAEGLVLLDGWNNAGSWPRMEYEIALGLGIKLGALPQFVPGPDLVSIGEMSRDLKTIDLGQAVA